MEWISVADASRVLRLSEQHVRRLASRGALTARRYPGGWLLAEESVRRRAQSTPAAGRPLSPRMSWLVLRSLSVLVEAEQGSRPDALAGVGDRRVRYRLRQLLAEAPPPEQWPSWLRRRGEVRRVWVSRAGVLARLASDSRLHPGGAASRPYRFYVRDDEFAAILEQHLLREDPEGQVEFLLVPAGAWGGLPDDASPAPAAAALVDLLESPDLGERRRAAAILHTAVARLATDV